MTHKEVMQIAERHLLNGMAWQHYAITFVRDGECDYLLTDSVNGAYGSIENTGGVPVKIGERVWIPAEDHSVPNYTGHHEVIWREAK